MKLNELVKSFEFDEIFPSIAQMYPNAKRHRKEFERAFNIMLDMRCTPTNRSIKYKILEDPNSGDRYYGAEDNDFKATWDILLGMEIKKMGKVDLTEEEILANCLLNAIFNGKHPADFSPEYNVLIRS
ncbi:MAG: hypothetical protein SOZ80_04595 [Prevotella sp.]|uniref:DUF6557 family protein n=1 Tax=Prevotella sp. TaxID=59823 RepID=UPI002A33DC4B|nr:DUF6557 family protein [Prevotella sp.]MDD7319172.1 hypothetical protein [Prevotellaceae bacterium]MDY4020040.1 hypothetical protein [Prevotella sp.]